MVTGSGSLRSGWLTKDMVHSIKSGNQMLNLKPLSELNPSISHVVKSVIDKPKDVTDKASAENEYVKAVEDDCDDDVDLDVEDTKDDTDVEDDNDVDEEDDYDVDGFVRVLLRNAASLVSKEGVIIVLHHTGSLDSMWNLNQIIAKHGLEKLGDNESLDPKLYPLFSPWRAGLDLNLRRIPSAYHCYRQK
ncbi:hypothetical protein Tco_1329190 [Tanacetum coccineum]